MTVYQLHHFFCRLPCLCMMHCLWAQCTDCSLFVFSGNS